MGRGRTGPVSRAPRGNEESGAPASRVEKAGNVSKEAKKSKRGILANVERLVETTDVREKLGIHIADGSGCSSSGTARACHVFRELTLSFSSAGAIHSHWRSNPMSSQASLGKCESSPLSVSPRWRARILLRAREHALAFRS